MDEHPQGISLADKLDAVLADLADGEVEITIEAISPGAIRFLARQVVRMGGSVEAEFEYILHASLPVDALRRFALQPFVWRVDWSRQVASPPDSDK